VRWPRFPAVRFIGVPGWRIASAASAAAVVAVFTILTSVVLANNDAAQLDRRLDSIIDASMYPEHVDDPAPRACSPPGAPSPPDK